MAQHTNNENVVVALLAGTLIGPLLIFCFSLITPYQPPRANIAASKSEPEHRPHANPTPLNLNDATIGKFGEAIVNPVTYFTCVLMVVAILQLCLARAQARDAQTRQRAWVVVEKMDGTLSTDKELPSDMVVFNSGETPAFIYRQITEAVLRPLDTVDLSADILAVSEKLQATDEISVVLAPNGMQKHTFKEAHENIVLDDATGKRIAYDGGTDTIFLIGMITYRDTFDKDHTSVCCYRWNASNDPTKKKWLGHRLHNHMD